MSTSETINNPDLQTSKAHRTNAEKRNAVDLLLTDPEARQWPDREIARRCGVSDRFVNKRRALLSANRSQMPAEAESAPQPTTRRVKRGGKSYSMRTDRIGKRKRPCPSPVPLPRNVLAVVLQNLNRRLHELSNQVNVARWRGFIGQEKALGDLLERIALLPEQTKASIAQQMAQR